MPTNDERREVAARLREFEQLRAAFKDSSICAFSDALGVGYMDWEHICARLADLIEPEERTCRMEPTGDGSVVCSACRTEYTSRWLHDGEYVERYCSNCGAKVIQE